MYQIRKQSAAFDAGYSNHPNRNPYTPGTISHSDYVAGQNEYADQLADPVREFSSMEMDCQRLIFGIDGRRANV